MPILQQQIEDRKNHVGSSDIAAIMGLSPYATAHDIWLEKTGRVEIVVSGEAIDLGNELENPLLDWFGKKTGLEIERNVNRIHADGILAANHDALVKDQPIGVEAKTGGLTGGYNPEWGADGTDEIPTHIIMQCQQQMVVSNLDMVYVPALIAGKGKCLYKIQRCDHICDLIVKKAKIFWDCVENDTPPGDNGPSPAIAKLVERDPDSETDVAEDVVQAWLDAKEEVKMAKELKKKAESKLFASLGDNAIGNSAIGTVRVKKIITHRIDTKAFESANLELAIKYTTESAYSRLFYKTKK